MEQIFILKISLTIIKSTSVCLAVASNHRKFADGLVRCYLSRCSRVSGDCMWLGWEQWSIKAGRVMAQRKALDQAIVPLSLLFLQRQSKLSRSVDFQRYDTISFLLYTRAYFTMKFAAATLLIACLAQSADAFAPASNGER